MKIRGFTLIEAIIAIFLLTVGTVGAFSLVQKTAVLASISSSQLVAAYLAQEGIEIIRNIRDSNYLAEIAWDSNLSMVTSYRLDYRSSSFPDATCGDYLRYNGSFYVCSSDSDSKFQRQITLTNPESDKIVVSVEVSWSERGRSHQVVAQTELYNWR